MTAELRDGEARVWCDRFACGKNTAPSRNFSSENPGWILFSAVNHTERHLCPNHDTAIRLSEWIENDAEIEYTK